MTMPSERKEKLLLGIDDPADCYCWEVLVNDRRVLVRYIPQNPQNDGSSSPMYWNVLSSAIVLGGLQQLDLSSSYFQILNAKVPHDYDGVTPEPAKLIQRLLEQESTSQDDFPTTSETTNMVGLLTAASMSTFSLVSQTASESGASASGGGRGMKVTVDAIVTAGISNSRCAGATADVISFAGSSDETGTINTIIVTNAPLDPSALVEAYAIACEAKCRACLHLGICCAKSPSEYAQGTGTDSTVLVTRAASGVKTASGGTIIYAGKHTLFGEILGQAVFQATEEALQQNITHLYGSILRYRLYCYRTQFLRAIREGHRPLVPSQPMNPVPRPRGWVLSIGLSGLFLIFGLRFLLDGNDSSTAYQQKLPGDDHSLFFDRLWQAHTKPSISVILAVLIEDQYLGSFLLPLAIHPVVLVGKLITNLLYLIPEPFFTQPIFGLFSGLVLFLCTLTLSLFASVGFLSLPYLLFEMALHSHAIVQRAFPFLSWYTQVFLVKGSLSLQLLCNLGHQMAHFLERNQLPDARLQLSWLCSRDPSTLHSDELAGATLESLAENLSDSLVSPLFWYTLLGPLGAFCFRVMNTLDSRVGFRGRYEWVGKVSARCDDVVNLVSARLTAIFLLVAAVILWCFPGNRRQASSLLLPSMLPLLITTCWNIAWKDARLCESPNAGWPMAMLAGILEVRLEKRNHYCLNGLARCPDYSDIRRGTAIVRLAGILSLALVVLVVLISGRTF